MRKKKTRGPFWRKWHATHHGHGNASPEISDEEWIEWKAHFTDHLGMSPHDHWLFGGRRFKPWFSRRWGPPALFNPFVAELLSKGGGLLPLYVLHLLAEKPRYGNDIMRAIEERTGGSWAPNPGAVYPLLGAMEQSALVIGEWEDEPKRTRRIYRLTQQGEKEYGRLKEIMRPKLKEAIGVLREMYADLETSDQEA